MKQSHPVLLNCSFSVFRIVVKLHTPLSLQPLHKTMMTSRGDASTFWSSTAVTLPMNEYSKNYKHKHVHVLHTSILYLWYSYLIVVILVSYGVHVALPVKLSNTKFLFGFCRTLYSTLPSSEMLNFICTDTFTCASIIVSPRIFGVSFSKLNKCKSFVKNSLTHIQIYSTSIKRFFLYVIYM